VYELIDSHYFGVDRIYFRKFSEPVLRLQLR